MFIKQQSLLLVYLFFLFQWIWGANRLYALETNHLHCEVSKNHKWQSDAEHPLSLHQPLLSTGREDLSWPSGYVEFHRPLSSTGREERKFREHESWIFHNDLMEHEEWILLKGLDSLCADTWCEGSFDFQFYAFKCSFKEQKCIFSYRSWDQSTRSIITVRPFTFICVIKAMDRKQLFGAELDFWVSSYLYSAVSQCIAEGENWIAGKENGATN